MNPHALLGTDARAAFLADLSATTSKADPLKSTTKDVGRELYPTTEPEGIGEELASERERLLSQSEEYRQKAIAAQDYETITHYYELADRAFREAQKHQ